MNEPQTIIHKGQKLILVDFSHFSLARDKNRFKSLLAEAGALIARQGAGAARVLTNVTQAEFDIEIVNALRAYTLQNSPFIQKSAVIGLAGLQRSIYQVLLFITKRNIALFDSEEEAKDWLIEP